MDHTALSILSYLIVPENFRRVLHSVNLIENEGLKGKPRAEILGLLAIHMAKDLSRNRPRPKKSKKKRIRTPITFGPADMPEIN